MINVSRRHLLKAAAATAVVSRAPAAWSADAAWRPTRQVQVVVGVSPGGSMDRTARQVEQLLSQDKLIPRSSIVLNKPGGGHAVALAYTVENRGNASIIQVINTPLLTNKLLKRSTLGYQDVTPLGNLMFEQMMFAVGRNSKIKTPADLVAQLKKDPSSLTFSVSSGLGTTNEIAVLMLGKSLGVDPRKLKPISFNSASEGTTSVVGGHVDVLVTTPFSVVPFLQSGDLRALAVAAKDRLGQTLKDVPTWLELGYDVQVPSPRYVVGPPGLSAAQIKFWGDAMARAVSSPQWKAILDQDYLTPGYMTPAQTGTFLKDQNDHYEALYREFGVIA